MKHLVISDIHMGFWGDRHKNNATALETFMQYASERGAELVLNGDIVDPYLCKTGRGSLDDLKWGCETFARLLEQYGLEGRQAVRFIMGNHDSLPDFSQNHWKSCANSLSQQDGTFKDIPNRKLFDLLDPDVAITHGHLLGGLRSVRTAIENALKEQLDPPQILDALNNCDDCLAEFKGVEERRNRLLHLLNQGLHRFLDIKLGPHILDILKSVEYKMHRAAHTLSTPYTPRGRSFTPDSAALFAHAVGARVCIVGHDHRPAIYERHPVVSRKFKDPVLVVYNGAWVGREQDRTAIELDTDKKEVSILHVGDQSIEKLKGPIHYE